MWTHISSRQGPSPPQARVVRQEDQKQGCHLPNCCPGVLGHRSGHDGMQRGKGRPEQESHAKAPPLGLDEGRRAENTRGRTL